MLSVILFLLLETTDLPHVVHFSPRRGCTTVLICNDWGADRGEGKGSKKRFWTHLHGGCNNSWPMVLGYYAIKTKEIWKRNKLLYFYIYIYIVEKSSFDKEGSFRTAQTIFSRCVTAKEKKKKKGRKRFTREPLLMASNTGPETPSSVPDPPRPSSAYRARCYLARWIGRCGEWKRPRRNQHPGLVVFPLPRVHGRIVGNLHPSTRLTRDIRETESISNQSATV